VRVTLIDRRVYNTFQPLLYQVATGGLNPGDVTHFLRSLRVRQPNLDVVHEHLMEIDPMPARCACSTVRRCRTTTCSWPTASRRRITARRGEGELVRGVPARRRSPSATPCSPGSSARRAGRRTKGLSVVVIGGGPTGIEMAGALAELRDQGLEPAYPELDGDAFRITLVQRSEILKLIPPKLRDYAAAQLRRRDVELRLGAGVDEVRPDAVVLSDGTVLPSDLTVWATGVAPTRRCATGACRWTRATASASARICRSWGCRGLRRRRRRDRAAGPAQLAQPAIQGGEHVARQIVRLIAGQPTQPFSYYDKGQLAIIGRRAAIGELPGIANLPGCTALRFLSKIPLLRKTVALTGSFGWLTWLFVHITSLLGPRNKLMVLIGPGRALRRAPVPHAGADRRRRARDPPVEGAAPAHPRGLSTPGAPGCGDSAPGASLTD
jgi:NADH dehydrogenase